MIQSRRLADAHAEMADEHRRLMALIARIEAQDSSSGLTPLLEELHGLLVNHFAHEQFPGGLYERMSATDTSCHEEIRTLVREHCEILSTARALLEHCRLQGQDTGASLLDDVSAFIGTLHAHEQREHRLAERLKQHADSTA